MESVLEKATYYDFYGYLIPGSVVVMTWVFATAYKNGVQNLLLYKGLFFYLFIAVCLISFVFGILLSEIARMLYDLLSNKDRKHLSKDSLGIDYGKIEEALVNAGTLERHKRHVIFSEVDVSKYMKFMYSDIQSDAVYKRIHNYASSVVLYKNLSCASVASGMILAYSGGKVCYGLIELCISLIVFMILFHRAERFSKKKDVYTVCWYVQKYTRVA